MKKIDKIIEWFVYDEETLDIGKLYLYDVTKNYEVCFDDLVQNLHKPEKQSNTEVSTDTNLIWFDLGKLQKLGIFPSAALNGSGKINPSLFVNDGKVRVREVASLKRRVLMIAGIIIILVALCFPVFWDHQVRHPFDHAFLKAWHRVRK